MKVFMPAASGHLHIKRAVKAYQGASLTRVSELDFLRIEAQLDRAAQASPSDPWPHELWARLLAEQGHLARAIAQQRQAVHKNPHDWTGHRDLARLLAGQARRSKSEQGFKSAIQTMQRALQCYPTKPDLHEEIADMYALQHSWADAVAHYKKALDYDQAKQLDAKFQWPSRHRREVQDKLEAAQRR